MFDYQVENAVRLRDVELLTGLRFLPSLPPEVRVTTLTFMPEALWERLGWVDAMGADGQCPDLETVDCPAG